MSVLIGEQIQNETRPNKRNQDIYKYFFISINVYSMCFFYIYIYLLKSVITGIFYLVKCDNFWWTYLYI